MVDAALPLAAPIETLNWLLPVLAGAPAHALGVHDVAVWPTPLSLVHVTELPLVMATDSGSKQNAVPPPLQAPDMMVMPTFVVACALVSGMVTANNPVAVAAAAMHLHAADGRRPSVNPRILLRSRKFSVPRRLSCVPSTHPTSLITVGGYAQSYSERPSLRRRPVARGGARKPQRLRCALRL